MIAVYPIYLQKALEDGYCVRIPDFDQFTEGKDLADSLFMARDAIGQMGNYLEDEGKKIPEPFSVATKAAKNETMALVDIDFDVYRKQNDTRTVRKNCTIPYYLEKEAMEKGINFSKVLTESLENILAIS